MQSKIGKTFYKGEIREKLELLVIYIFLQTSLASNYSIYLASSGPNQSILLASLALTRSIDLTSAASNWGTLWASSASTRSTTLVLHQPNMQTYKQTIECYIIIVKVKITENNMERYTSSSCSESEEEVYFPSSPEIFDFETDPYR